MKDRVGLVLLPGLAGAASEFAAQSAWFRTQRPVVALDPFVDGDLSVAGQADQLAESIGRLAGRFVLLGHSQGGVVALDLARRHPELLAGLVLLDAPILLPAAVRTVLPVPLSLLRTPVARPLLRRFFTATFTASDPPEQRAEVLRRLDGVPVDVARVVVQGAFTYDTTAALRTLTVPALVIRANIPVRLHRLPAAVRRGEVLGVGHWPHVQAPDLVNGLVGEFLSTAVEGAVASTEGAQVRSQHG